MNYILGVKLGIRTRAGHHIHVAAHVRSIYVAGSFAQKDHLTDCYVYSAKTHGHNSKSKRAIVYLNIPSTLRPVKHDDSLPVPKPPQQRLLHKEEPTSISPEDEPGPSCSNVDPDFPELTVLHPISQSRT